MDYILCHADEPSGDSMSLTLRTLAMMHAPEIKNEMISKGFSEKILLFLLWSTMLIT